MPSRIKLGYAKDEPTLHNVFSDLTWISANRLALFQEYGECTVVVFQQKIIGKGKTYDEALADAETHLAEDVEVITPAVGTIYNPNVSYFAIKQMMREYFERKRQNNSSE